MGGAGKTSPSIPCRAAGTNLICPAPPVLAEPSGKTSVSTRATYPRALSSQGVCQSRHGTRAGRPVIDLDSTPVPKRRPLLAGGPAADGARRGLPNPPPRRIRGRTELGEAVWPGCPWRPSFKVSPLHARPSFRRHTFSRSSCVTYPRSCQCCNSYTCSLGMVRARRRDPPAMAVSVNG